MLRPYRPSDEDDLIRVWLASTIAGQSFLPKEHWTAMEPEVRQHLLPVARTWVIEEEGELVAFMSLLGNLIGGLFTDPAHQSEGHGSRLVAHARAHFDPLFVEVFEANEDALGFYRSRGFVDNERRTDEGSGLTQLVLRMERDV